MHEVPLVPENCAVVQAAFEGVKKVDISLDCIFEGSMGEVLVDSLEDPSVFMAQVGPFRYFAGDPTHPNAKELVLQLTNGNLVMPSKPGWIKLVQEVFGDQVYEFDRFMFSSETLSVKQLKAVFSEVKYTEDITRLTEFMIKRSMADRDSFIDVSAFGSSQSFTENGVGFCNIRNGKMLGAAYSSLRCHDAIEMSVFVLNRFRRMGLATGVAIKLILHCLEHSWEPHWDGANIESCKMAEKLGYKFLGKYPAYYLGME